jgi:hypothetical protein
MKVYYYKSNSDKFDGLQEDADNRSQFSNAVYRTPGDRWEAPTVKVNRTTGRWGDFPSLRGTLPVLSPRAWECLRPLVGGYVEPLPVKCKKGDLYLLNVLADCPHFDQARSEVRWDDYLQAVIGVYKYAFTPEAVFTEHLFRIGTQDKRTYVTEVFRQAVEANNLNGLTWIEIPMVT